MMERPHIPEFNRRDYLYLLCYHFRGVLVHKCSSLLIKTNTHYLFKHDAVW